MGKKFYAVRKGKKPGIYTDWNECSLQVRGFSGAEFKGFDTVEEAEAFLDGSLEGDVKADRESAEGAEFGFGKTGEAVAYVDGSFDVNGKAFSYGIVLFADGEELQFSAKCFKESLNDMRNVAGEITGARRAMEYCLEMGIGSLDLYYDYEGIAKWCTGEWRTNKEGTKRYKEFYDSIKDRLKVNFYKVAAHTGNEYNELADKLAKKALGIK